MPVLLIYTISILSGLLGKTEFGLIPCPFKYLTHLDCPGCGFQRATLALLKGQVAESFHLYPPTIPILLSGLAALMVYTFKLDKNANALKIMYVATGIIVLVNYIYKVGTHQL